MRSMVSQEPWSRYEKMWLLVCSGVDLVYVNVVEDLDVVESLREHIRFLISDVRHVPGRAMPKSPL